MKRLVAAACLALAAFSGVGMSTHTTVLAAKGGNSDAAHMCQQGGYLTLQRSDGTTFKNVGECVSYAAHGGVLSPIPACTVSQVSPGTGCITLDNVNFTPIRDQSLGTITLSGIYSFSPTAMTCSFSCTGVASGGGTYTLSSGSTFNGGATSGTFTVTSLKSTEYTVNNTDTTCVDASQNGIAIIDVNATFTSTTGTWSGILEVEAGSDGNDDARIRDQNQNNLFHTDSPAPGLSISC